MNFLRTLLIASALFVLLPVRAEVFSLWPFRGGDAWMSDSEDMLLSPAKLWTEKITVNSVPVEMNISLVSMTFEKCAELLFKTYRNARFAANSDTLVMERKLPDGHRLRTLLVKVSGVYPVIQFSMILPEGRTGRADWPSEFPLPPGAQPVTVMHFPSRNASFGMFRSNESASVCLSSVAASLRDSGWTPVTAEHGDSFSGTGEIFLKKNPAMMMVIGFSRDSGVTTGSLYMRPAK